jgi:hypothetical protein
MKDYYFYFDESGNLGRERNSFVISCIFTNNPKELQNIMKKTLLKLKQNTEKDNFNSNELKASAAKPQSREIILKNISNKDLKISYIVANKNEIYDYLFKDKNILYNYLLKLLLRNYTNIFRKASQEGATINLILDNRDVKVKSKNSFTEFIKEHFIYYKNINVNINVEYKDSKAKDAYNVQAADYIAHALYSYYEFGNNRYYNCIKNKIQHREYFPNYEAIQNLIDITKAI